MPVEHDGVSRPIERCLLDKDKVPLSVEAYKPIPPQSNTTCDESTCNHGMSYPPNRCLLDWNSASVFTKYTNTQLRQLQLEDPDLKHTLKWIETATGPSQHELQILSPAVKYFWTNASPHA